MDTGGRLTKWTNDVAVGAARAERDLGCRYLVGIYDRHPREDVPRPIVVRVRRPGLTAMHPAEYVFRSRSARRGALLQAAFAAPDMFHAGVIRAHVFPLLPAGRKAWECLVAVDFPVTVPGGSAAPIEREFGATVRRGGTVVHQSSRRVTLHAKGDAEESERRVSFLDRVVLAPGTYEITAVLSSADADLPSTVRVRIEVPPVPRKRAFLVGPYLGQRAGRDIVIHAEREDSKRKPRAGVLESPKDRIGSAESFEPLLVWRLTEDRDVAALTLACESGKERAVGSDVRRTLAGAEGKVLGELPAVVFHPASADGPRCQTLLDFLPSKLLPPGRYSLEAAFDPAPSSGDASSEVSFTVAP